MVMITMLGRDFDIAPYSLGDMLKAAPFADAQQARQRSIEERAGVQYLPDDEDEIRVIKAREIARYQTVGETMQGLADSVRILHIGIAKLDPSITVDDLIDGVEPSPNSFQAIYSAAMAVMHASGLQPGESPAPAAAATPAA
jgi:hypothetical protein